MNRIRTLSAGALLVATLTSCATPAKDSKSTDANGKKIEYVYITPTGSNVPVLVAREVANASDNDSAASQTKMFTDMQRNGSAGTPQSPGGK
jgi:hypothetical protein